MLYGLIALSAVAMGVQSTVARRIGVPGIMTTYFTGTITAVVVHMVSDASARKRRSQIRWPVLSFVAYVLGAALTGYLLHLNGTAPVWISALALPVLPAVLIVVVLLITLIHGGLKLGSRRSV